ncbi:nuclear transport factor 2 family protein [Runella aurantiaca]|uniref:Nuclear transport factor 2 family protein n=1 Tax=Runella aurantiaca TaxID=2282308 RepID=A0A369I476_9BACT|nr:nuclear transport factor 2 family protein [Runella aurantiaca]RDB03700.1 nuclear transport factor 2 family protein [Runella aurantiaca]
MKKLILTLALSFVMLTIGSIYAQTDLKTAFEKGMADYDKNPTEAVQQMDDNIRFVAGHSGQFYDKAATLALAKSRPAAKSETQMSDLRVKQSGNLGVVSGIRNHALVLPNNQKMTWKDAFTYTFEWKKNNWVLTDIHHTKIDYQTGEEAAVRQVIDAETKAYHEANLAVLGSNFATTPYIERHDEKLRKMANTPYLKGDALQKVYEAFPKTHKPTGLNAVVSDYESHVSGNLAWATYTQEDKKADGSVAQKQRFLRILEKINGQWKIVMISLTGF